MPPKERQTDLYIVRKYGKNAYDLACIDEINETIFIPYADMDQLRVCVVIVEEHPETVKYPVGEPHRA